MRWLVGILCIFLLWWLASHHLLREVAYDALDLTDKTLSWGYEKYQGLKKQLQQDSATPEDFGGSDTSPQVNTPSASGYSNVQAEVLQRPKITGDAEYVSVMNQALDLIEGVDFDDYRFVCEYIDEIRQVDRGSGIEVGSKEGYVVFKNRLDKDWYSGYALVAFEGSQIVHEAQHERDFIEGHDFYGEDAERRAMEKQNEFLRRAGCPGMCYNIEEKLKERYWEVSRDRQWW